MGNCEARDRYIGHIYPVQGPTLAEADKEVFSSEKEGLYPLVLLNSDQAKPSRLGSVIS